MKQIPLSVWLSALVLLIVSGFTAWTHPYQFFEALVYVTVGMAFGRVLYWFIGEYND
jgi:membrane protein DedA with SNARE-associated domain